MVDNAPAREFRGLSTDAKPSNVENGAVFVEMDTGNVFMFDAVSKQWLQL